MKFLSLNILRLKSLSNLFSLFLSFFMQNSFPYRRSQEEEEEEEEEEKVFRRGRAMGIFDTRDEPSVIFE